MIYFLLAGQVDAQEPARGPVRVIFDTDMGPDYDDVGAITLLHAFADSGKATILATVASTRYEGVAGVLNVLNTYFKRPDLPIGIAGQNGLLLRDWQGWTDTLLRRYPHRIRSNDEVPDAVTVYRKILSAQPDNSVTIVTVGFLTNLAGLLRSGPDRYAALDGPSLIARKVHRLVCMAGRFTTGKEFNIEKDAAASKYAFDNWNTPILFSGFEIGAKIKTGLPLIHNKDIRNSPVRDVFSICIPMAPGDSAGRMSWDETAVLVAVLGPERFFHQRPGRIVIMPDGSNGWNPEGTRDAYLEEAMPATALQQYLDRLIMHQPRK